MSEARCGIPDIAALIRATGGLLVDLDGQDEVADFDIDFASKRFDLSKIETVALPLPAAGAA